MNTDKIRIYYPCSSVAKNHGYGFRVEFVFLFEDARGECLDGVAFQHGHCALRDDWTTIERLVDEVDRATTHLHTVLERLSLCVESGKLRQQARMNVEDPHPE